MLLKLKFINFSCVCVLYCYPILESVSICIVLLRDTYDLNVLTRFEMAKKLKSE